MKPQGQITVNIDGRYIFDAAPHVMARIRRIFDAGLPMWEQGRYTHKPVLLPRTMSAARDLVWIAERYPLDIEPGLRAAIGAAAEEYDRILTAVSGADQDTTFRASDRALKLALALRPHQVSFRNMALKVKRMLLMDKLGLGKTFSAASLFCEPEARPALVVVPTTLVAQWQQQVNRLLPDAKVHVIPGFKVYDLPPDADVIITTYTRLRPWQDVLGDPKVVFPTVVFDEVQELRHTGTDKRQVSTALSAKAQVAVGLTGTPIYNYGEEMWSVVDAVAPAALGKRDDFVAEWCVEKKVREPVVLHSYLKNLGLFLRRTPEEAGLDFGKVSKNVYTLSGDLETLKAVENVAKALAVSVLSGVVGESDRASAELDWKLRQATGIAKARPAAEFVKLLLEEERKVVLVGWHRSTYDIWLKELEAFKPAMITGSETPAEKEKEKQRFLADDTCRVLILSLGTAAGIDGLQYVASKMVFGELAWSPHVMDQLIGRLARDGQTQHVQAFFLTIDDGADPFMMQVLNLKRSQHDGLVEGLEAEAQILDAGVGRERIREMAAAYLRSIGEEVPAPIPEVGLLAEVAGALRRIRVPVSTEAEMQAAMVGPLVQLLPTARVEREVRVGKRSRLDFLVTRDAERVAIECKVTATGRQEVYRQVRKYTEEAEITSLALFAPWGGVTSFIVDKTPVMVVNCAAAGL